MTLADAVDKVMRDALKKAQCAGELREVFVPLAKLLEHLPITDGQRPAVAGCFQRWSLQTNLHKRDPRLYRVVAERFNHLAQDSASAESEFVTNT